MHEDTDTVTEDEMTGVAVIAPVVVMQSVMEPVVTPVVEPQAEGDGVCSVDCDALVEPRDDGDETRELLGTDEAVMVSLCDAERVGVATLLPHEEGESWLVCDAEDEGH